MKVLLVDDSEDLADVMSMHLSASGYEVVLACNGQQVLEYPSLSSIDVIVMDVQMPVMDGLTATRKLREKGCKVPIIACTGMQDSSIEEKIIAAGCSSYIEKPIDFASFLPLVEKLGGRSS